MCSGMATIIIATVRYRQVAPTTTVRTYSNSKICAHDSGRGQKVLMIDPTSQSQTCSLLLVLVAEEASYAQHPAVVICLAKSRQRSIKVIDGSTASDIASPVVSSSQPSLAPCLWSCFFLDACKAMPQHLQA